MGAGETENPQFTCRFLNGHDGLSTRRGMKYVSYLKQQRSNVLYLYRLVLNRSDYEFIIEYCFCYFYFCL